MCSVMYVFCHVCWDVMYVFCDACVLSCVLSCVSRVMCSNDCVCVQNVDHLSWLGLYKDISAGTSLQPFWNKQTLGGKRTAEHKRRVYEKFLRMRQVFCFFSRQLCLSGTDYYFSSRFISYK